MIWRYIKRKLSEKQIHDSEKDIKTYIKCLEGLSNEEIAFTVVIAGIAKERLNSTMNIDLDNIINYLDSYKLDMTIVSLGLLIRRLQKNKQYHMASGIMVWLHTVKSLRLPQIRIYGRYMWRQLSRGFGDIEEALHDANQVFSIIPHDLSYYKSIPKGLESFKKIQKIKTNHFIGAFTSEHFKIVANELFEDLEGPNPKRGQITHYSDSRHHFATEQTRDMLLEKYKSISENILSETAKNDTRIGICAIAAIFSDYSPEEAVIRSYIYDLAQQVKDTGPDAFKLMDIFYSIEPMLRLFKEWKDSGRVRNDLWKKETTIIFKIAKIDKDQEKWVEAALKELNRVNPDNKLTPGKP